ncbi:MAG: hypothetical protein ACQEWI_07285 [Bacillota bacterium]
MLIRAFKKYIVLCEGPDHNLYRWNLDVVPGKKAWRVIDGAFDEKDKRIIHVSPD